ncbi:T9SS type A sorting domain-containing protein [Prolixibacter denitrificans]|uniref:Putative secreted protein (Por secretion system target) n=1 Tax=Prolixibacter denitrificans TaxID=1541063 RepID=A0A2P8C7L7_9BACT|nr:T9SS type A sorting domain-containing protein [Prolixibacter denitrificans]PSK80958.1 putative secreted protein (Por secretion system target) [Prolixibacter denitrificans]GET22358.1 hypothetical protein JCM18694_26040 [Prolixibacter denitrificans]
MKKILAVIFLPVAFIANGQNANNLLHPDVWLRADQLTETNTVWNDISGNQLDAIPSDSLMLKGEGLINFNRTVSFNGQKEQFKIPLNLSQTSQLTIVAVYHSKDTTSERAVWSAVVKPEQSVMLSTRRAAGPQSIAKYSEGTISVPMVNTTAEYWGKASSGVTGASLWLGSGASIADSLQNFSGDMAELLVFKRLLSGPELQLVQSYLSLKYGTTFQYSSYLTSTGQVVWDYEAHPEFSKTVAGIGRDDGFLLNQKQTEYADDPKLLVIGADKIAASNENNTATINKGDFLVWGMNDKAFQLERSEQEVYPYTYPVLQRKWMMSVTGKTASSVPTEMKFNTKAYAKDKEVKQCYLVIDRSGTNDYSLKDVEYIPADTLSSDGIATFDKVTWDPDGSGSDSFTFSFGMDNGVRCTDPLCHNASTGTVNVEVMGGKAPYQFQLVSDSLGFKKDWTGTSRFQVVDNLASGAYTLAVTDGKSQTAVDKITIDNPEDFNFGLDSLYTMNLGDPLVLDAGTHISDSTAFYTWEGDDGYYATTKDATITYPGEYQVSVTNQYGCSASQNITVKVPDGILYHYQLYPNPSRGQYHIDISLTKAIPVTVRIYNIQGALQSTRMGEGSFNYHFDGELDQAGLYLVKIETSSGTETFKLVINRN